MYKDKKIKVLQYVSCGILSYAYYVLQYDLCVIWNAYLIKRMILNILWNILIQIYPVSMYLCIFILCILFFFLNIEALNKEAVGSKC